MNAYTKSIEKRKWLWEPNNDDKKSILIEKYMANRLKKETLFGCSNLTRRSPESFICLGTVLSSFLAERVRSLTRFVNEGIKKSGKRYILTA